jgi:hypothetical protein
MDFYDFPRHPGQFAGTLPVAANVVIDSGALVAVDSSGNAQNAASAITGFVAGRSQGGADNTGGAAGDKTVLVERGVFEPKQDNTNPVTKAHIGRMVYATAPDVVAHTGTCRAGKLLGFSTAGLPIVDTTFARGGPQVTLASTNGTAAAAVDLNALKAESELIGDDVRAIHAALVAAGILRA